MKITIISLWAQKLFRPDEPLPHGGAELQLVLLAREMARQFGVEIRFITRGHGPFEQFDADGIKVAKLPYRKTRVGRSLFGLWDLYKTICADPGDVLLQRGGGFETGTVGWAAKRTRTPFLFMTSSAWDVDGTHATGRGALYGYFYLSGLKQAGAVIAQSEFQQERLRSGLGIDSRVLRSAHPIPDRIPSQKIGALWVGRCEPVKDPGYFLDLAESLPDIPFTMVCPKANSEAMMDRISSRANAAANVRFIPGLPFEETEKLFASHRLFVCAAEKEGFPNTYVQAAKWGTPIISRNVNPDGILTRYDMGFCADGDRSKQAEIIKAWHGDEKACQAKSANARNYAIKNHNIKSIAAELHQELKNLCGKEAAAKA